MVQAINCSPVEREIENYQDLKRELKRIWKLSRVSVVLIIIGWCIRNCLERYRKVVSRDWCHMSFGIIAEGVLTGYSQNPSQSLRHLRSWAVT